MIDTLAIRQGFFLNSWHFLYFSFTVIVLVRFTNGILRRSVLLCSGLYFLSHMVHGPQSCFFLGGFVVLSYLLGEYRLRFEANFAPWLFVFFVIIFWLLLFLVKDPSLFAPVNPFFLFPVAIAGISFIIFRCMQYFMDVDVFEKRGFIPFLSFVFFFPTLLAGPLERFENYRDFYTGQRITKDECILPALHRIANGFIKKFVLADNLYVFAIYARPDGVDWPPLVLVIGLLCPLLILYWDFSGYCDIMIGICRLMGFELAENFNRPWLARNVQEFWERWHMTLSRFVRDYVFTPISRKIYMKAGRFHFPFIIMNYLFCMMLIALWHGTTWGFFVFGLLHGAALVYVLLRKKMSYPKYVQNEFGLVSSFVNNGARLFTYCYISFTMAFWYMGPAKVLDVFRSVIKSLFHAV
jgi:alginate O-acetyltransferase complex protein AlgI